MFLFQSVLATHFVKQLIKQLRILHNVADNLLRIDAVDLIEIGHEAVVHETRKGSVLEILDSEDDVDLLFNVRIQFHHLFEIDVFG